MTQLPNTVFLRSRVNKTETKNEKENRTICLAGLQNISRPSLLRSTVGDGKTHFLRENRNKYKIYCQMKGTLNHEILPRSARRNKRLNTSTKIAKFCQIMTIISDSFSF